MIVGAGFQNNKLASRLSIPGVAPQAVAIGGGARRRRAPRRANTVTGGGGGGDNGVKIAMLTARKNVQKAKRLLTSQKRILGQLKVCLNLKDAEIQKKLFAFN